MSWYGKNRFLGIQGAWEKQSRNKREGSKFFPNPGRAPVSVVVFRALSSTILSQNCLHFNLVTVVRS